MAITYQPRWRRTNVETQWSSYPAITASTEVITGLLPGTQYDVMVAAINAFGETDSNIVQQTTALGESAEAALVSIPDITTAIYASRVTQTASPTGPWNKFQLTSGSQILLTNPDNSTQLLGSAVQEILYHQHCLFQFAGTPTAHYWYWDPSLATPNWSALFTVASISLVTTQYSPNLPGNSVVSTINVAMGSGESHTFASWGGQITLSGNDAPNFTVVGSTLYVANGHNLTASTYTALNVIASVVVANQTLGSATLTPALTAIAPAPTPAPTPAPSPSPSPTGLTRQFLTGVNSLGATTPSPTFSSSIGWMPDHMGTLGQREDGSTGMNNSGFPWVGSTAHYELSDSTYNDPVASAAGNYNTAYTAAATAYNSRKTYAVRIDHEWTAGGDQFHTHSPFYTSTTVPAATWIAGFQQMVQCFRNVNPNIKICWDYPVGWDMPNRGYSIAQSLAYYPGDAYVDIISADIYFQDGYPNANYVGGNGTSLDGWRYLFGQASNGGWPSGFRLSDMASFAAGTHPNRNNGVSKPMAIPEWADCFMDGFIVGQFLKWMARPTSDPGLVTPVNTVVVFETYWDKGLPSNWCNTADTSLGRLQGVSARYNAWVSAHSTLSPTCTNIASNGGYWPTYYPCPGTGTPPAGY